MATAFEAGTRVGHYEIVGLLGAGGMGEVYRARDSRLDREVALKVLPLGIAHDESRRRRFEQEARITASLSHPNIVAIHDVGTDHGRAFMVAELLVGSTLRDRLEAGPLPVRTTIEIMRQVAAGLGAAHAKGVIHRDIKPENIFLPAEGHVKILDFGLARLVAPAAASATATTAGPGHVVGTASYMSPEQAQARPLDARSDIFSLGAVFFEMLAGRRAFEGASTTETLRAILGSDPPPLPGIENEALLRGLGHVVRRCLEREPERRFQSAADLAIALEAFASASDDGRGGRPVRQRWGAHVPIPGRRRTASTAVLLVALASLVGAGAWLRTSGPAAWAPRPASQDRASPAEERGRAQPGLAGSRSAGRGAGPFAYVANMHSDSVSVVDVSDGTGVATIAAGTNPVAVAVAPGRAEAYVANFGSADLTVFDIRNNRATGRIAVGERPFAIVFSPDGQRAYVSNGGSRTVSVIDTARHAVTKNIPGLGNVRGLAISPDGSRIYAVNEERPASVAIIDTKRNVVTNTVRMQGADPVGVVLTPDGRRAYVTVGQNGGPFVAVLDTARGVVTATVAVGEVPTLPAMTPDGARVFVPNWGSRTVSVIDTATDMVVATVEVGVGPYSAAVSPDGGMVYVTNTVEGVVTTIDVATNEVTATTGVGATPQGLAVAFGRVSAGIPVGRPGGQRPAGAGGPGAEARALGVLVPPASGR
jgi:YVTN family beta-propeller protein